MIKGFCLCGSRHAKISERILGDIKLESEHLSISIDGVRKGINKGLGQGKMPTKRLRDWVEEAIAIESEANEVVQSAQENSSFLEVGQLMNTLKKIDDVLKRCPFDHGLRPVNAPVIVHDSHIVSPEEIRRKEPQRRAAPRMKVGISTAQEMVAEESMKTGENRKMPHHKQDAKTNDKVNAMRSKHLVTEQRRRSKINERNVREKVQRSTVLAGVRAGVEARAVARARIYPGDNI